MPTLLIRDPRGVVKAEVLVDEDVYGWASRNRWNIDPSGGYVFRKPRTPGDWQRRTKVYLHRQILGLRPGDGLIGDHIDRNKLDCRRANLRILDRQTNPQNTSARHGCSSRYRGVDWSKQKQKWRVRVRKSHVGFFDDEDAAGRAASAARAKVLPYAID
jgi:hypothetical protein